MYRHVLALVVALALASASAYATGWGMFGVISSTLGSSSNRLCMSAAGGYGHAGDIGCPSYSPYVTSGGLLGVGTATPTTALEVSGTVSATHFVGDGSGFTGGGW